MKIEQYFAGQQPPPSKRKYRDCAQQIARIVGRLDYACLGARQKDIKIQNIQVRERRATKDLPVQLNFFPELHVATCLEQKNLKQAETSCIINLHILLQLPMIDRDLINIPSIFDLIYLEPKAKSATLQPDCVAIPDDWLNSGGLSLTFNMLMFTIFILYYEIKGNTDGKSAEKIDYVDVWHPQILTE
uniref:Uncharacterized protein n=1 Tax=Romanomermis culicivorax TaxID=13658 RepID=A0A915I073_ROMCU